MRKNIQLSLQKSGHVGIQIPENIERKHIENEV